MMSNTFHIGDTVRHATENLRAVILSCHPSTRGNGAPGPVFYLVVFIGGHLVGSTLMLAEDVLVAA